MKVRTHSHKTISAMSLTIKAQSLQLSTPVYFVRT